MTTKVEVTLLDGRTNSSESDTQSSAPIKLLLQQATADAADLLATNYDENGDVTRDDAKFDALLGEIVAKTTARENDKWTRSISGAIYRKRKVIGHFTGESHYRFD